MKAYNLLDINKLVYSDLPIPQINDDWVVLKVMAAGICSSDIPRIFKKGTYHFPTIPGHEFSGVVSEVANKQKKHWIGKRVAAYPLIPCNNCEQCKKKHYEMCEHYDYIGSRRDGAFAEYVAVPEWNLIELNDLITYEEAAMVEPVSVALHAVKKIHIDCSDDVAIVGTGIIGFAAAEWVNRLSSKHLTILGRSRDKAQIAEEIQIHYANIHSIEDNRYDVVFESVGSNDAICDAIRLLKANGKLVLIGNPSSDIILPQDIYWKILRKQITLIGSWNSYFESGAECDWSDTIDAISKREINIKPFITHRFPQEQLLDALELMRVHKEPYCKVMTIWNKEDR